MNANTFLLLNLARAFYGVGAIWAHEVDIFRSWKLLDPATFHRVQTVHWHKLPYWVLVPVAFILIGAVALTFYHPPGSPDAAIWGGLGCVIAADVLTAFLWGPWQAKLSKDDRGGASPYLEKILSTHWIRTLLVNAYGVILLVWTVRVLG